MTKRMYMATIWFHFAAEDEMEADEVADQIKQVIGDLTTELPIGDFGISEIEPLE